jgi:hypothetical protein
MQILDLSALSATPSRDRYTVTSFFSSCAAPSRHVPARNHHHNNNQFVLLSPSSHVAIANATPLPRALGLTLTLTLTLSRSLALTMNLLAAMSRTEAIMGVHPVRFVDDVYNFCTQYIKRSVDSLEGTLASDEETKEDPTAVRDGCAGCQARLIGAFDKNIDKFELYVVRNCMRIPVHIDESSASIIAAAGAVTAGLDGKCAFPPRNPFPSFREFYEDCGPRRNRQGWTPCTGLEALV